MVRKVDPVKHEEKRAEILDAAERCFARHGFHGATIAQICAEAKMSPGHLYHYFPTKEAIVWAIAGAGLAYATSRSAQILYGAHPIKTLVAEIELINAGHEKAGPGVLLDVLAEAGRDPAVGEILRESSASMRVLVADFLRRGQVNGQIDPDLDTDTAAAVLISIIDASKALSIRAPNLNRKRRSKALERLITRFLSPPSEAENA
ncbi:MAG TPA: TetR/AcrR family transcriptional regulator [Myxococcota bacterium]|nr:TetR/AcrR family transcriptional regulator [Myxococcota bacterium]